VCEGRRRVKPQCVLNKSVCTYLWCEKRKRERTRNVTAHSVGLPPVQLSTIGVTHRMMGLRQSLRDSQSLMRGGKPWSNITGSDCGRVCRGGVEVSSTRRRSPWVNMRRSLRVGAWNVLSLREDDHLSYHLRSSVWTSVLQHSLRFGDRIAATSWWVVAPAISLVTLMVTKPKELLKLCPLS